MSISEDASQPLPQYNHFASGGTVHTLSFSPPVSCLLASVTVRYQGSTAPSITVTGGGTWTLKTSKAGNGVAAYQYINYLASAPGSIQVAATDATAHACTIGINVKVLDNANPTQTGGATANTGATNTAMWGTITPTTQWSRLFICGVIDTVEAKSPVLSSNTLTEETFQDNDNQSTHLQGRWVTESGSSFSAQQLGWVPPLSGDWAWVATEILSADVNKASSDTGTGSDSTTTAAGIKAKVPAADAGTGLEPRNFGTGTGASLFVASSDTGTGTDAAGTISKTWINVGSADAGTGSDVSVPVNLNVHAPGDVGTGNEYSYVPYRSLPLSTAIALATNEGFSLDRVSVLNGTTGAEQAQLYGAQQITMSPALTLSDMQADDEEYGTWAMLSKVQLQVTNGFLSFSTIDLLAGPGVAVQSSGLSPADYYGLPLWTQYQHNQPSVPLVFRMASADEFGIGVRSMTFVLYKVQLSVLDFTGIVYKTGLQVNYAGTILFSSFDEQGNALASPEMGRVVSAAGHPAGAFTAQPFAGI